MKTIDLNTASLIDTKATSSKGNQLKWLVRNNWYKADHMGYEGLCEVIVSKLLEKSNIGNFVSYEPIRIVFDGREMNGCYSKNFRQKNESLVTLEHLSKQWLANSFAKELTRYPDVKDKIQHTVDFVEKVTKLENVGAYLTTMLELDAFFISPLSWMMIPASTVSARILISDCHCLPIRPKIIQWARTSIS